MKEADFRSLIKGERQKLIHYVRSLFKETAAMDAEDVVHDVLLKLLERPASSESFDSLTGYVYRSVKNRVIDLVRTRKSTVSLDKQRDDEDASFVELLADGAPTAFESLQTEEGEQALFEGLSELTDMERQVLIAHEFEGIAFKDLSIRLSIPLNTLLSHKARALKKLKEHFSSLE
ncbi:MAG TPA: RNA polymerase sigma factor [Steroidobacteraceae bacterium]|nr:RNA polymerase sigma factor [Steroidobacteraceae bacterium]